MFAVLCAERITAAPNKEMAGDNAVAADGNNAAPVFKEATGGQVQTIPEFHGREGLETLEWVRFITSAARQYKWSPETTAAVAKSRFRTYAARWY